MNKKVKYLGVGTVLGVTLFSSVVLANTLSQIALLNDNGTYTVRKGDISGQLECISTLSLQLLKDGIILLILIPYKLKLF